ncbi:MAG: hypothetical protein WC295_05615 [Methanoregula sp.]
MLAMNRDIARECVFLFSEKTPAPAMTCDAVRKVSGILQLPVSRAGKYRVELS